MKIKKTQFIKSSTSLEECPKGDFPEFVFFGRSNVGKSTLINAITNNQKLSKISSKPGKTQLINHFLINITLLIMKSLIQLRMFFHPLRAFSVAVKIDPYCLKSYKL